MTPEQYAEGVRLREAGYSVSEAAAAIGVTRSALGSACHKGGVRLGHVRLPRLLTPRQLADAETRHKAGEVWSEIARSYGVGRSTLCTHIRELRNAGDDKISKGPVKGPCFASQIQHWRPREIRRVIKPAVEVNHLARLFVAGKISRDQFVRGIRA